LRRSVATTILAKALYVATKNAISSLTFTGCAARLALDKAEEEARVALDKAKEESRLSLEKTKEGVRLLGRRALLWKRQKRRSIVAPPAQSLAQLRAERDALKSR